MILTIADVLTEIHTRTGEHARTKGDPSYVTYPAHEPLLKIHVATAAADIARRTGLVEATETIEVSAGTNGYAIPHNTRKVAKAILKCGARITRLTAISGPTAMMKADAAGEPYWFGIFAGQLYIAPKPTTDGTLELFLLLESAWDGNEFVQVPLQPAYKQAIVAYCLARWYENIPGAEGLSSSSFSEYEHLVESIDKPLLPDTARLKPHVHI